jgi:hypothetical protein
MVSTKSDTTGRFILYYPERMTRMLIILLVSCALFVPVHAAQSPWKYPLPPDVTYEGNLNRVTISDDGQYSAAWVADENTLLYFNQSGTLLWSKQFTAKRPPWISSLSIARDDSTVAISELVPGCCEGSVTNTTSNRIILFDRNGTVLWNYTTMHPPLAVAFSPDASRVYAGTDDRQVLCLDRNGSVQWISTADAPVYGLAISGDGTMIAAAGSNPGKTSLGTVDYPEDLFMFNRTGSELWAFRTGGPNTVAISEDGSTLAVVGGKFGNLYLFNRTGYLILQHSFPETGTSLAMSEDAGLVVAGTAGGSLYGLDRSGTVVWDIKTSRLSRTVAVAHDGGSVVFGNGSSIMMVNHSGSVILDYPTGAWVSSVAMSGDGRNAVALSDAIYFFHAQGNSTTTSWPVTDPSLTINPVGDHAIGDIINITDTTNFPAGTALWVSAGPRTFTNYEPDYFVGQTAVIRGPERNLWSISVNTSLFSVDEYSLSVGPMDGSSILSNVTFNITPHRAGTPPTIISVAATAMTIPEASPYIPTPKPASLPIIIPVVATGCVALFRHYRKE